MSNNIISRSYDQENESNSASRRNMTLEAEQSVIGAMILDNSIINDACRLLNQDHFFYATYKRLFSLIRKIDAAGSPVDLITLSDALDSSDSGNDCGGLAHIAELIKNTPSARNWSAYADIIIDGWVGRESAKVATSIANGRLSLESAAVKLKALAAENRKSGSDILDEDVDERYVDIIRHSPNNLIFRFGEEIAKAAKFPTQTAALVTLGVFSTIASSAYCIESPDGSTLSLGLYVASEQPPATAKSRVLSYSKKPIVKALYKSFKKEEERRANAAAQAAQEKKPETVDEVDVDAACEAAEEKELRLLAPFVTNSTSAALDDIAKRNNGFFSILSAEQGAITSVLGVGQSTVNDNDMVLLAFTGDEDYSSSRASRKGFNGCPWACVVVIAQDGTIDKIIDNSNGQGVVERFLMITEPNLFGKRDFSVTHTINVEISNEYKRLVEELADINTSIVPKSINDLRKLNISPSGLDEIAKFKQYVEPHLIDGCRYSDPILRSSFGKADLQIMKVAGLLHLSKGKREHVQIDARTVKEAIGIVNEILSNLHNILEKKGKLGKPAEYKAILEYFENRKEATKTQVKQSKRNVSPFKGKKNVNAELDKTITEMISTGYLVQRRTETGVTLLSVGK